MTTATTRRDSSFRQFQKRAPEDIVERARGRSYLITLPAFGPTPVDVVEVTIRPSISFSLRVRDPAAAKMRVGSVIVQLEQIFSSLRNGPVSLTHKKALELAGEVYREFVQRFQEEPGEPEDWEAWKGFTWAAIEGRVANPPSVSWRNFTYDRHAALGRFGVESGPDLLEAIESLPPGDNTLGMEVRFGLLATWVLNRHQLEITTESRLKLLKQVAEAALDAASAMKRAAQGDYTPDPKANRFPPVSVETASSGMTLAALFDHWRMRRNPRPPRWQLGSRWSLPCVSTLRMQPFSD